MPVSKTQCMALYNSLDTAAKFRPFDALSLYPTTSLLTIAFL